MTDKSDYEASLEASIAKLIAALTGVLDAVKALGEGVPGKPYGYFEASLVHDDGDPYVEAVCEGKHTRLCQIGRWGGDWDLQLIGEPLFWQPLPDPPNAAQLPPINPLAASGAGVRGVGR